MSFIWNTIENHPVKAYRIVTTQMFLNLYPLKNFSTNEYILLQWKQQTLRWYKMIYVLSVRDEIPFSVYMIKYYIYQQTVTQHDRYWNFIILIRHDDLIVIILGNRNKLVS